MPVKREVYSRVHYGCINGIFIRIECKIFYEWGGNSESFNYRACAPDVIAAKLDTPTRSSCPLLLESLGTECTSSLYECLLGFGRFKRICLGPLGAFDPAPARILGTAGTPQYLMMAKLTLPISLLTNIPKFSPIERVEKIEFCSVVLLCRAIVYFGPKSKKWSWNYACKLTHCVVRVTGLCSHLETPTLRLVSWHWSLRHS